MTLSLGIDIGGTKISYALINENGEIAGEIQKTNTPKTIDEIEIARRKPHWNAIAKLLQYYDKQLEITIVNKTKSAD